MEIDITSLLEQDQFALSHSRAEGGENAGNDTWRASLERADEVTLLDTPEKVQAMRDFARSSGGWDESECNAWSTHEVNALFLQWIAGDVRECPAKLEDWQFVERTPGQWWAENDEEECGPFESRSEAYQNMIDSARPPRAGSLDEIDWEEYYSDENSGGSLSRNDDGTIYFYLGN